MISEREEMGGGTVIGAEGEMFKKWYSSPWWETDGNRKLEVVGHSVSVVRTLWMVMRMPVLDVGPWSNDAAHIQVNLPSSVKPLHIEGYTQCIGDTQLTVPLLGLVNVLAVPTCLQTH